MRPIADTLLILAVLTGRRMPVSVFDRRASRDRIPAVCWPGVGLCLLIIAVTPSFFGCDRNDVSTAAAESGAHVAVAETDPPLDLVSMRQEGLAALEANEVDTADQLARAAFAANPQDPENIGLLAIVLAEQNRFAEAITRLENLAEEVPSTRLPVLGQTAAWLVEQGRWLEAEQRCMEILDARADASSVHRLLVQLYTRQGRRLDAAKHLRILCRLGNIEESELQALIRTFYSFLRDVKDYGPIGELGIAHYQISTGDWAAAEETLSQVSNRNPAETALLGRIYIQQQRFDRLSEWASNVPDAAKVTADYWFAMGVHDARQGDHVSAIKKLCAAVVRDYTDHQAYAWLSRSLEAINAEAQAAEAATRAEQIAETQRIATELTATPQPDLKRMAELVDLLSLLQRQFEALSWRAVLLVYGGSSVTQDQAQQMLAEINQNRLRLLESQEPVPSREFLLCGITPEILQAAGNNASPNN